MDTKGQGEQDKGTPIYGSYVTQITDFISPTEVKVNQTFNEFLEKYGYQEPEIVIDPLNNFRNVNIIYKNNDKRVSL